MGRYGCSLTFFAVTGLVQAQTLATFTLKERFGISHPDQLVEFSYSGRVINTPNARMLGPSGEEVPYQQLSTGKVLVRTSLPASRIATAFSITQMDTKADTITINLNLLTGAYPVTGDVIRCEGSNPPGGLVEAQNYFLRKVSAVNYQLSRRKDLSDTVDIMSVHSFVARKQGWIVDPDDAGHSLYAKAHGYQTGDPIRLKSSAHLPDPLVTDHPYFVIKTSADTFRLALSRADALKNNAVNLTTLGTGVFETTVEWTWTLDGGEPPTAPTTNPVRLSDLGTFFEITNGLTGVRVVKPSGNVNPVSLAPIQAVRLTDSTWTATGPNYIYQSYSENLANFLTSYTLSVIESGPLMVRLQAHYVLNRPQYTYGSGGGFYITAVDTKASTLTLAGNQYYWNRSTSMQFHANDGRLPCGLLEDKLYWPLTRTYDPASNQTTFTLSDVKGGAVVALTCPQTGKPNAQETMNLAGLGYFKETITLYAGHKSIVIEDDTDSQLQYFLNFYNSGTFVPDQARYRGHGASLDCGHSLQGAVPVPYVPYTDALFDLSYKSRRDSFYVCNSSDMKFAPIWYMASSGYNTGWYWEFYNAGGSSSSPLIGYYVGRTSRYVTSIFAGPGVYTSPSHFASKQAPAAGITMHVGLRTADGRSTQRTRREWALYVSTKADLRDPTQTQLIGLERNILAGINLTRLGSYIFEYPDPVAGWPPPYQDKAIYEQFVQRIRSDSTFASYVGNVSPGLRDLIGMWEGNSTANVEMVVSYLEQFAHHWEDILVNQNGDFDSWWHYYQPGLVWEPLLTRALAVLSSNAATPSQRNRTKAVGAFVASVFWDDDYVPWDTDSGDGTGNANQGDQYSLYRAQNALTLFTQPLMAGNRSTAQQYAEATYKSYLHPISGAPRGSTHYHGAAMDPALANFLDLKNAGVDMIHYPQWGNYGRWLISALTPPEPRFGNPRKMVSLGDGNTEATALHGMVASLLRQTTPELSSQLQWCWLSEGQPHDEFTAPSILVIDPNAPVSTPNLRSGNYLGYWSMFRHGFGTPNETALWFTNGDFYSDHRHADSGQVTIYAHSAPLSIDWNANLYNPQVSGGLQHNRVIRESEIGQFWKADNLSLAAGANWGSAGQTLFAGFENSSDAQTAFLASDGTTWTRHATEFAPDLTYPIIYVRDDFSGPSSSDSKVLTWNLMAQGTVGTPTGPYTPIPRLNTAGTSTPNVLPSNGPDYVLSSGLQHFSFTGQTWAAHATKGIDWDLYLIPHGVQHFLIGSWGHNQQSGREAGQYRQANGTPFQESQYILRVQGTGSFSTLILPYRKGETPSRTVTQAACGILISQPSESLCISDASYQFSDRSRKILTTFSAQPAQFDQISASGGPTEVVATFDEVRITASGSAGTRLITLPGTWTAPASITSSGSTYRLDYQGGDPVTVVLKRQPISPPLSRR